LDAEVKRRIARAQRTWLGPPKNQEAVMHALAGHRWCTKHKNWYDGDCALCMPGWTGKQKFSFAGLWERDVQ
jgi:hypothetical protein